MASTAASPTQRVEQFFQTSLVLLVANGFFATLFAGRLDPVTSVATGAALLLRLLRVLDVIRFDVPKWVVTLLTLCCAAFYALDVLALSQAFVPATIRLLFLVTALKLLSATAGRDYFYLGLLAFLHLLAASMFIPGVGYLGVLLLFLCLAVTTVVGYEIKRGCESGARIVGEPGAKSFGLGTRLAAVGATMALGILALSAALFVLLPRVIGRPPVSPLRFDPVIGFSAEVDLGAIGALQPDNTPVMRIQGLEGDIRRLRWRGLALSRFDGMRWSNPTPRSQLVETGQYATPRRWSQSPGTRLHYRVMLEPLGSQALFVAGVPEQIISGSFDRLVVDETESLRVLDAGLQALHYEVFSWITERSSQRPADVSEFFSARFNRLYLQLPTMDPRIAELARQVVGARPTMLGQAEALESYLRGGYGYTLNLPSEVRPDPLADFLFERREGHCEYFATAMTVMLRSLGIPSRLVNGFAGGVENPISGLHVIRSRDAHSWVEAYLPGYGWLEFDPTPPAPDALMNPWVAQLWMYWDALESAWADWVLEYDFAHQIDLARSVQGRTRSAAFHVVKSIDENLGYFRRLWESLTSLTGGSPSQSSQLLLIWIVGALAAVVAATFGLRKLISAGLAVRRARRLQKGRGLPSDSVFFYRRALKILERRGVQRRPWQTAEEFSRSAASLELRGLLEPITAAYCAARYGLNREAEQRLPALVQSLERARF